MRCDVCYGDLEAEDSIPGSHDSAFNYCPYCGRARPGPAEIHVRVDVATKDIWELCEIDVRTFEEGKFRTLGLFGTRNSKLRFVAEAIGPGGRRAVAESQVFEGDWNNGVVRVFSSSAPRQEKAMETAAFQEYEPLVERLARDGWEVIPVPGDEGLFLYWREYRFQRRIGSGQ